MVNIEEYVKMLENKKIKPYQLENVIFDNIKEGKDENDAWKEACQIASEVRLSWIERLTGKKYETIRRSYISTELDNKRLTGIENKIGGAVVPLGFSGPVKINGEYANGEYIIPLATNEAALIAGNNRGVSAINMSGGITTVITRDMMTRAPVVELPSIRAARDLVSEIKKKGDLYTQLKNAVEEKSRFTKLKDIQPFQIGRFVWLRCAFFTGNAMGMNSVTKYSAVVIRKLQELRKDVKLLALSGNMCADKKVTAVNPLLGKGKGVVAEVVIPRKVIEQVWKTTPEAMVKVNNVKNWVGSGLAGTITGFNANAANTVAAFYAATGQDLAHVGTSSTCYDYLEVVKDGLLFSITMPNVEVGSIGGGMYFGTAKECLAMIGCDDPSDEGSAKRVAEVLAAAVAAQEINLIGTLANMFELAESHVKLARGETEGTRTRGSEQKN